MQWPSCLCWLADVNIGQNLCWYQCQRDPLPVLVGTSKVWFLSSLTQLLPIICTPEIGITEFLWFFIQCFSRKQVSVPLYYSQSTCTAVSKIVTCTCTFIFESDSKLLFFLWHLLHTGVWHYFVLLTFCICKICKKI